MFSTKRAVTLIALFTLYFTLPTLSVASYPLEQTISRRQSIRSYTSENVSAQQLSEVLQAAYGIWSNHRSTPQIGYEYSLIIFPVNATASYRYIPENNTVVLHDINVNKETIAPNWGHSDASFVLVVVWNRTKMNNQYFASAEAGCLVQNVYLAAASLDLGTCCVGSINSEGLRNNLKLPTDLIPLLVMPLGYPAYPYSAASPNYDFMTGNLPPVQYSTLSFQDAVKNIQFAHQWRVGWSYRKSHVINAVSSQTDIKYIEKPVLLNLTMNAWDGAGRFFGVGYVDGVPTLWWSPNGNSKNLAWRYTFPSSGIRPTIFIDSQNNIFVSLQNSTSGQYGITYKSADQGQTFTSVCNYYFWNMDEDSNGNIYGGLYENGMYVCKIYKTTDKGSTWTDISSSQWSNHRHVHNVRYDPSSGWLYAALGDARPYDGVWRSKLKDGSDWGFKGLSNDTYYQFIGIAFKDGYVYLSSDSGDGMIWRFQDDGTSNAQTFESVYDGINQQIFVLEKDGSDNLWSCLSIGGGIAKILYSTNGATWNEVKSAGVTYDSCCFGTRNFRCVTSEMVWQWNGNAVYCSYEKEGENYQVKITVHYGSGTDSGENVYLNQHCRTDFGDVRFMDDDGETILDYWMEKKVDSDYAVFWVTVTDDLSTVNQTIYIYYGNVDATTTSNGDSTFLLFDHFDGDSLNSSKWVGVLGSFTVQNSLVKPNAQYACFRNMQPYESLRMRFYANFTPTSTYSRFRALARWNGANLGTAGTTYELQLDYRSNQKQLIKRVAGTATTLNYTSGSEANVYGTWDWLITGNNKQILMKESQVLADTADSAIPDANYTGFEGRFANDWEMDWCFVSKYVDPEPSHGTWGSEEGVRAPAENLSLQELSQLLWAAYGYTNVTYGDSYHRTTPSAYGIYPLVIFVSNATGVYQYLPENHSVMEVIHADKRFDIANACSSQIWAADAPAIFLIVYNSSYNNGNTGDGGTLSHEFIEVDAGAVVQQLFLEASAWNLSANIVSQGLENWNSTGAQELRNILDLPPSLIPLYTVPIGAKPPDITPPTIGTPFQNPDPTAVEPYQNVTVTVDVVDYETEIREVILSYSINASQTWINTKMNNISNNTYMGKIPGFETGTHVQYKIIAYDNANNTAVEDKNGEYYVYTVIPESPNLLVFIFIITTLITVIIKISKRANSHRFSMRKPRR